MEAGKVHQERNVVLIKGRLFARHLFLHFVFTVPIQPYPYLTHPQTPTLSPTFPPLSLSPMKVTTLASSVLVATTTLFSFLSTTSAHMAMSNPPGQAGPWSNDPRSDVHAWIGYDKKTFPCGKHLHTFFFEVLKKNSPRNIIFTHTLSIHSFSPPSFLFSSIIFFAFLHHLFHTQTVNKKRRVQEGSSLNLQSRRGDPRPLLEL